MAIEDMIWLLEHSGEPDPALRKVVDQHPEMVKGFPEPLEESPSISVMIGYDKIIPVSRRTRTSINPFFLFVAVLMVATGIGGCWAGNGNSAPDLTAAAKETVQARSTSVASQTQASIIHPISTELSSIVPTATPDVMTKVLADLQSRGINVAHDTSRPDGEYEVLLNGSRVPDATLDSTGLHIVFIEGGRIDVPPQQVADRLMVKDGSLVLKNEGGVVLMVYDPNLTTEKWGGIWVKRVEAINTDLDSPEKYIKVDTWDELDELRTLTLAFSPGFSDKAQWPPFDQITRNYYSKAPDDPAELARWINLFGVRTDPETQITALRNVVALSANKDEGRDWPACIAFQGFLNVDRSESILSAGYSGKTIEECANGSLRGSMGEGNDGSIDGDFVMPEPYAPLSVGIKRWEVVQASLKRLGLFEDGDVSPRVKELIDQWLSTGMFPGEFREAIFRVSRRGYY